jgi:hypothetical protein
MRKSLLRSSQVTAAAASAAKTRVVMAYLAAGQATAEGLEPDVVRERVVQDSLRALEARLGNT